MAACRAERRRGYNSAEEGSMYSLKLKEVHCRKGVGSGGSMPERIKEKDTIATVGVGCVLELSGVRCGKGVDSGGSMLDRIKEKYATATGG